MLRNLVSMCASLCVIVCISNFASLQQLRAQATNDFPVYNVPGFEHEMTLVRELHGLHHSSAFSDCTLWDMWLPHSTLWVDSDKRNAYRESFLKRRIDREGYVAMQQHRGLGHSDGWPFPAYQQSGGKGWHFSLEGEAWGVQQLGLQQQTDTTDWTIGGAEVIGIDNQSGLALRITSNEAVITTPPIDCDTLVAPFARLEWAADALPTSASASLSWQCDSNDWMDAASVRLSLPTNEMKYENVPLYRSKLYSGTLKRYRIRIKNADQATITLKSIITAIDTRHPITNSLYMIGCTDYFAWTGDVDFLKLVWPNLKRALKFAIDEFDVEQNKHVCVPWVGHDGRSGIVYDNSVKQLRPGFGVGNNYWDLLPFGGHDALSTIYLYHAIQRMIELERWLRGHPDLEVDMEADQLEQLELLASKIKTDFQSRFWSKETGRFVGWIDVDDKSYDYGFTFVNLEAICYDLASEEQSHSILDWLDGKRIIDGDTSQGADIYRWRFAPRATTKRNIETYMWAWSAPESIRWGHQVQDGGAVLGFSYHDLMARLKTRGPDDAWRRLQEILKWFEEVQNAGGYRAYYSVPSRGTLQGGGTAGGLGLDEEFMESVLVPQVMLYGFMGFKPQGDTFTITPKLPTAWPSLTIESIQVQDRILNITCEANGQTKIIDQAH
jgi:hypothetical protein